MKKYLTISLIMLIFIANSNSYAADDNAQTLELRTPQEIRDATAMEQAFFNYVIQKAECTNKRQNPSTPCNRLSKYHTAKATYQNTIELHPGWQNKRLHWNSPKDHYLNFNSFIRSFR